MIIFEKLWYFCSGLSRLSSFCRLINHLCWFVLQLCKTKTNKVNCLAATLLVLLLSVCRTEFVAYEPFNYAANAAGAEEFLHGKGVADEVSAARQFGWASGSTWLVAPPDKGAIFSPTSNPGPASVAAPFGDPFENGAVNLESAFDRGVGESAFVARRDLHPDTVAAIVAAGEVTACALLNCPDRCRVAMALGNAFLSTDGQTLQGMGAMYALGLASRGNDQVSPAEFTSSSKSLGMSTFERSLFERRALVCFRLESAQNSVVRYLSLSDDNQQSGFNFDALGNGQAGEVRNSASLADLNKFSLFLDIGYVEYIRIATNPLDMESGVPVTPTAAPTPLPTPPCDTRINCNSCVGGKIICQFLQSFFF